MAQETGFEIGEIAAAGYRSLRAIHFPPRRLSVFVGANGVGKTNLYRGLQLIQAAAAGRLSRELAAQGRHGGCALGRQAPGQETGADQIAGWARSAGSGGCECPLRVAL
jgi:ABC-type branched-subunit amino acid transport system ATPase component